MAVQSLLVQSRAGEACSQLYRWQTPLISGGVMMVWTVVAGGVSRPIKITQGAIAGFRFRSDACIFSVDGVNFISPESEKLRGPARMTESSKT
jgi:hypothetical protein